MHIMGGFGIYVYLYTLGILNFMGNLDEANTLAHGKKKGGGLSINDSVLYVHRLAVFNFVNRRSYRCCIGKKIIRKGTTYIQKQKHFREVMGFLMNIISLTVSD